MSDAPRRRPDRPPGQVERRGVERLLRDLGAGERIPRREGELAFDAPWEIRAFALAVAAQREGHFAWQSFQAELVSAIRAWEAAPEADRGDWSYYRQWLSALERLAEERGLATAEEIDNRSQEFLSGRRDPRHR